MAGKRTGKALTPKQARFVQEYLIDLNATQAAIRAGYSAKTATQIAYQILSYPDVAAAVAAAQMRLAAKLEITAESVLREYARLAFSDIRKVVRWGDSIAVLDPAASAKRDDKRDDKGDDKGDEPVYRLVHGIALSDAASLDADVAAGIAEISQSRDGLKVKLHDKKGALMALAKHLGLFADVEVNVSFADRLAKARARAGFTGPRHPPAQSGGSDREGPRQEMPRIKRGMT